MITLFPKNVLDGVETLDLSIAVPSSIPELQQVLNHSAMIGGKKLRPLLTFLMGNFLGVKNQDIAPYARVSELLHTATLAHDDVIDQANQRRGSQTINAVSGNAKAVLAGDFLLAKVVWELSHLGNLGIVKDVAQVLEDMSSGEWMQLERRYSVDVTYQALQESAYKKTASLMAWCCRAPAWLSGGSLVLLSTSKRLGYELGLCFQMADDLLDFEEGTGKSYAQDFKDGLINFVSFELLDQNPELKTKFETIWAKAGVKDLNWTSVDSFPWSEAELELAKSQSKSKLEKFAAQARQTIHEISAWSVSPQAERETMIKAFEALIEMIVKRKK